MVNYKKCQAAECAGQQFCAKHAATTEEQQTLKGNVNR